MLTSGSLFAGYGGLTLAVEDALGAVPAWVSDVEPGANRILADRFPGIPNLGDITTVDWATVPRVDVIEGGSPCQDVSAAGKRAGMRAGTRSGLWASMCDAIDIIRPRLVVWENVRGVLSAGADSALEPCPICVGDERDTHLRALGRVVGDLSELGYDAAWCGLRAADVGAPHGRYRVFVLGWLVQDADRSAGGERRVAAPRQAEGGRSRADAGGRGGASASLTVLATPRAAASRTSRSAATHRDSMSGPSLEQCIEIAAGTLPREFSSWDELPPSWRGNPVATVRPSLDRLAPTLLPTPTARDNKGHNQRGDDSCLTGALLPTPRATDGVKGDPNQRGSSGDLMLPAAVQPERWGAYAAAIAGWERTLGHPAPAPTELNSRGGQRLAPAFVEWLMGLPAGWVTDVPGLTRNDQLKALGNGVVPQQGAAAIRHLIARVPASVLAERAA